MSDKIKIGTRGSKLALWQTHFVAGVLNKAGIQTEILAIETKGDKLLGQAFAEIGTKGIFTEELEEKLVAGELDIAVHSAKDMQTQLPEGLEIIAFTKREEPNDVLVSLDPDFKFKNSPEVLIGTSSTRRRAMLKYYYPEVKVADARGNLQTRFRKMEEGQFKAMILAYAGVHRMGFDKYIIEKLPLDKFVPAVGQGSIAIEASAGLSKSKKDKIRELLNHPETEMILKAERAFLNRLQGGCSIPAFGMAVFKGANLSLTGGIADLQGKELIKLEKSGNSADGVSMGITLAEEVLDAGGKRILSEFKK
ncbi:MAG: hydroxymethylbilane synthase [Cytophagaceae bacterium]